MEVLDRAVKDLASGDYAAAERGFQSVLRAQPNSAGALGNLAIVYSRTPVCVPAKLAGVSSSGTYK